MMMWVSEYDRTCYPTVFSTSFRPVNNSRTADVDIAAEIDLFRKNLTTQKRQRTLYSFFTEQGLNIQISKSSLGVKVTSAEAKYVRCGVGKLLGHCWSG